MTAQTKGSALPSLSTSSTSSAAKHLHSAEARYRALIDARLGIVWRAAPDLSVLEAWGWHEATGQTSSEYIGSGWLNVVHPGDRENILAILADGRRLGRPFEGTYRARQSKGDYRWVQARAVPLQDDTGSISEWVGTLIDVHEKVEADVALHLGEERLRLALESSAVGVWDYDYRTGVGWWSEAKRAVLGLPHDYPINQASFLALVHPDDKAKVEAQITRAKQPDSGGRFEAEFRVCRYGGGGDVWIESRGQVFFDAAGTPVRIVGTMRDTTEQRAAQQKLFHLAHFDQLTGLANREHFTRRLEEAAKTKAGGMVILLDLDGFKDVNDTAGHPAGDLLLRAVGERLVAKLPQQAVVSRWGGDEFAVLVPSQGRELQSDQILPDIEQCFEAPFHLLRREVFLSTCTGVAVAPDHGKSADELLLHADLALYRAKADGRGAIKIFCPELKREMQNRIDLESDLRRAFASSQFELHYQPQVKMADGRIVGAEALLRWRHPEKGLLSPAVFLDVLKSSPISRAVGEWSLSVACAFAAKCLRAGHPIRVGVNLFSAQIRAGGFVDSVARSLRENNIPPELLELEITENTILKGSSQTLQTFIDLRSLGVGIAFDDYGTGYASLSMLTEYPLTRLKIDKAFVNRTHNSGNEAVVNAIVKLGHAFGIAVTAEGVETNEQAEVLRALGCDEGQGYLFGRPAPENEMLSLIGIYSPKIVA